MIYLFDTTSQAFASYSYALVFGPVGLTLSLVDGTSLNHSFVVGLPPVELSSGLGLIVVTTHICCLSLYAFVELCSELLVLPFCCCVLNFRLRPLVVLRR